MANAIKKGILVNFAVLAGFLVLMAPTVSSTEIESGYIEIDSSADHTEDLGFKPDYIEFISAQQINSLNMEESAPNQNDFVDDGGPEYDGCNLKNGYINSNGWSEGSALFDEDGIDKQFTIGAFRNSYSTNDHRVVSSTSHVIRSVYASQNGEKCGDTGELNISVKQRLDDGFELDVERNYNEFDEIIRYKAYQFPDNMEFNAGMVKVDSEGKDYVETGFKPANIHIRAAQQIGEKNIDRQFEDNDPDEIKNTLGRSKGYATMNNMGNVIDQQSIGTASSSHSTDAHRSIASDEYVLNTAYVGQDGDLFGRLRAKISSANSTGFEYNVDDKWSETDDVFLYRAWGFSFYEYDVGYEVVDEEKTYEFGTTHDGSGFRPDAIDIYAEQQIGSINNEVTTPLNEECKNAGGWSNGYYERKDDNQWAIGVGRTSDSQNSHRMASSNDYSLVNLYTDQDADTSRDTGEECGKLYGEVEQTLSDGFEMSFTFGENFADNYAIDRTYTNEDTAEETFDIKGGEMVYYRALNFLLTPPTTETAEIYNKSVGHSFGVNATIEEGANDIDDCEITVEGVNPDEGVEVYDAQVEQINSSYSACEYEWINYDDNSEWNQSHNDAGILPTVNVSINATGSDGFSSQTNYTKKFPNTPPQVESLTFANYSELHAFNVSSVLKDVDADVENELSTCEIVFMDEQGNTADKTPSLDYNLGDENESGCFYSNVNSSMPEPSGDFEVMEDIEVKLNVTDRHGAESLRTDTNPIPNDPPFAYRPEPSDGGTVSKFPVEVSSFVDDSESDEINVTVYNGSGGILYTEDNLFDGSQFEFEWKVDNALETQYNWIVETEDKWSKSNTTFSFTKIVGRNYRSDLNVDLNYSSIVMNAGDSRLTELTITNNVENDKNLTVNLTGIKSEFLDGDTQKTFPDFNGQSSRSYLLRINPDEATDEDLVVVVRNNDLGIETRETISVSTLSSTGEANEVPGIGLIQVVFLIAVSTVLYSVRL